MSPAFFFFFFNDTATTEIYTLSLHDALPISWFGKSERPVATIASGRAFFASSGMISGVGLASAKMTGFLRSEEHTSELQSRLHLVCRLLLEKKKKENRESNYE